MRFQTFWVLYFLWILIPIFLFFLRDTKKRKNFLERWIGIERFKCLTENVSWKKRRAQKILECAGFLMILIALARPLLGKSQEEVKRRGIDIVIAIDTSSSMLAEDFSPSRLEKAKRELVSLLGQLQGNRVGLVGFAGEALVLCPLTLDVNILKTYLEILDTQLIGIQGTALGEAIKKSVGLFDKGQGYGRVIILLTDGEDHGSQTLEAAREALAQKIRIYPIGIGAGSREPIPLFDENGNRIGHKKDEKGEIILSQLDEKILQEIARVTGGKYYRATSSEIEIERIFREIKQLEKGELGEISLTQYEERFQIPLMLGFIFLVIAELLGERKGIFKKIRGSFFKTKSTS